jgi:hypothetical protein
MVGMLGSYAAAVQESMTTEEAVQALSEFGNKSVDEEVVSEVNSLLGVETTDTTDETTGQDTGATDTGTGTTGTDGGTDTGGTGTDTGSTGTDSGTGTGTDTPTQ